MGGDGGQEGGGDPSEKRRMGWGREGEVGRRRGGGGGERVGGKICEGRIRVGGVMSQGVQRMASSGQAVQKGPSDEPSLELMVVMIRSQQSIGFGNVPTVVLYFEDCTCTRPVSLLLTA